jgi:hypothetical protein
MIAQIHDDKESDEMNHADDYLDGLKVFSTSLLNISAENSWSKINWHISGL